MTTRTEQLRVLHALHDLARRGVSADTARLARETALPPGRVLRSLAALDAADLVDRRRARLTLQGLAVALATRAVGRLRRALPRAA